MYWNRWKVWSRPQKVKQIWLEKTQPWFTSCFISCICFCIFTSHLCVIHHHMVLAHPPSLKLLYPRSPGTTYTMPSGLPPVCIIFSVILTRSTSLPFWHSLLFWPIALLLLLRFLLLHLRQSKFKSFEFRISAGSSFTSEFCIVCSIMNSPFFILLQRSLML